MNAVEPIRDSERIKDVRDYLKTKSDRDALLFLFGIYSGFRISDVLPVRVRDVKGKSFFETMEKKTGKVRKIPIHKVLKEEIAKYVKDKRDYEFLFKSRKGANKPICRQQAYRILNDAGKEFGLDLIGTHTMRKTFGYHLYKQTNDIVLVQKMLGHSSPVITEAYIGLNSERMEEAVLSLKY